MQLDLPPDSLGPKPTKKQMELLKKLATPGATCKTWMGTSPGSGGAYIDYHATGDEVKHENMNAGTLHKFADWGWIVRTGGDWRGGEYTVTERGRKRIELGETR